MRFAREKLLLAILLGMGLVVTRPCTVWCRARPAAAQATVARANWAGSWATSQQIPEPQNALAPDDLRDATLRQIVHLSVGGRTLRVHLSNAFGNMPLHLTTVHIARPVSTSSSAIDPT